MRAVLLLACAMVLIGCGPRLPYTAHPTLSRAKNLSADYSVLADRVRVDVYTQGYRFETVQLETADGRMLDPTTIEYETGGRGGLSVGGGVGSGGSGVGVGVGFGSPSSRVEGNTEVYFKRAGAGEAPWTLHVKLLSHPATQIELPAKGR